MTKKNIIFSRLGKTGPKIYEVVNIIWPDIWRSRFFLRDSWHSGVRLFSGGSYVGKRKDALVCVSHTRFFGRSASIQICFFCVPVGCFFVDIIV